MYLNVSENGALAFLDVTEQAGVCASGYGMGIATGDIDNDGDLDVFLANFGPNQLLENLGDGRFRDVTPSHAFAADRWSVSANFADFDGDGLVDLYVTNYVDFELAKHEPYRDDVNGPSYWEVYRATPELFRNLGDGGFADVGVEAHREPAVCAINEDFDGDLRVTERLTLPASNVA